MRSTERKDPMIDGHIHLERGAYTPEWIDRFVERAVECGLEEIRLLEHCYRFAEFVPMYGAVCAHSAYIDAWFRRKAGVLRLEDYLELIRRVRDRQYPVRIKFGLEICYFREYEEFIAEAAKDKGLDFLLGSIHFVENFAFDHKAEHWKGMDVDRIYRAFFEDSVSLARSGLFDGLGHPDSIKLFGHKPSFPLTQYYERLADALSASNMYADQNSGVARRCPETASLGMEPELLRILKGKHVEIITSSDAHSPEDVGDKIRELQACVDNCRAFF